MLQLTRISFNRFTKLQYIFYTLCVYVSVSRRQDDDCLGALRNDSIE